MPLCRIVASIHQNILYYLASCYHWDYRKQKLSKNEDGTSNTKSTHRRYPKMIRMMTRTINKVPNTTANTTASVTFTPDNIELKAMASLVCLHMCIGGLYVKGFEDSITHNRWRPNPTRWWQIIAAMLRNIWKYYSLKNILTEREKEHLTNINIQFRTVRESHLFIRR